MMMKPAAQGPASKPNFGEDENDEFQNQIMAGVKEFYRQKELENYSVLTTNVP